MDIQNGISMELLKLMIASLFLFLGIGSMLFIVVKNPDLKTRQFLILKTVLAFLIAMGSFLFVGSMDITGKAFSMELSATAGFALFVIVFFVLGKGKEQKHNSEKRTQEINNSTINAPVINGDLND